MKKFGQTGNWILATMLLGCIGFGGGLLALHHATISHGLVVSGSIEAGNNVISIRHPQGRRLMRSLVKRGDYVHRGDPLFIFDSRVQQLQLKTVSVSRELLQSRSARLIRELMLIKSLLSKAISKKNLIHAVSLNANTTLNELDQSLFHARINQLVQTLIRQKHDLEISREKRAGLLRSNDLIVRKMQILEREIGVLQELANREIIRLSVVQSREMDLLNLRLEVEENRALIILSGQEIEQFEPLRNELMFGAIESRIVELQNNNNLLATLREAVGRHRHDIHNTIVRSPINGWIVNTRSLNSPVSTLGSEILASILEDGPLVAVVSIPSRRRNAITMGQMAQLRIEDGTSPRSHLQPGMLEYVSAAMVLSPTTNKQGFEARISFDSKQVQKDSVKVGMPVTVSFEGKETSVLAYLLAPIENILATAFE